MGSLAQLAVALGHRVTGSDTNVYPPMSTQLSDAGIELIEGYDPAQLHPAPDLVVVGNALSRGNPCVEHVLNQGLRYASGPQWFGEYCLSGRWVLAVAGTHGKTTTASMLAWILEYAGLKPGYLIGGVPKNFGVSARLGETPFFVVEADEYDTAFFDKRSKFVHYHPRTLILNNLEYDHADIFPDLAAIQTQFHHLIRTVPSEGLIIWPEREQALAEVLARGCWTPTETISSAVNSGLEPATTGPWQSRLLEASGGAFELRLHGDAVATVSWAQMGEHNVANGVAAMIAARHAGVPIEIAAEALGQFDGVKRRMEHLANMNGVHIYDDFAHHPTAIATTLSGLRKQVGDARVIAVIEPRSNTMKMGTLRDQLASATVEADSVLWLQSPDSDWSLEETLTHANSDGNRAEVFSDLDALLNATVLLAKKHTQTQTDTHIVIMSNGSFGGFHQRLLEAIK